MGGNDCQMKIKPLYNNVLIEPMEEEQTTASGIVIPDTASKEKPQQGKVIAVGSGKTAEGKEVKLPVKEGDTVIYKKWGGNEVENEGKEYLIVKSEDILAVVS